MTYEKALEIIKNEIFDGTEEEAEKIGDEATAVFMAIKALKKQIPKKVVRKHEEYAPWYIDGYFCPSCGETAEAEADDPFDRYELNWCDHCGQRLDWNDYMHDNGR